MTEDQKWRQAKRLACKMNKLVSNFTVTQYYYVSNSFVK